MTEERARELAIARTLRQALNTAGRTMGDMSNDDAIAGSAEFLVQVLVEAHAAERAQTGPTPLDEIAGRLDALHAEIKRVVLHQLRQRWGHVPH